MILGTDVSIWQDDNSTPQQINFQKMKLAGAKFVFIKASQATRLDQDYIYNWTSAKHLLLRGSYHYLDWTKSAKEQARFYAGVLQADPGELPAVVDYECRTNVPSAGATRQALKEFLVEFKLVLPNKKIILYTSPGYWMEFGSADIYWKQFDLWLAHYYAVSPRIPLPWTKFTFWQFTDKGDGLFFGAESKQIDLNWFNGTEAELNAYAENVPVPELTDKEKLEILWREASLRSWNLTK